MPACIYSFNVQTVAQFVTAAQLFENTGVRAYTGAVDTISSETLLTVAATIATVEARHAAYLNVLVGQSPFPNSFDNATTPSNIVALITPYIQSCPYALNVAALPIPLSSLPKGSSTVSPSSTATTTTLTTTTSTSRSAAIQVSACVALIILLAGLAMQ